MGTGEKRLGLVVQGKIKLNQDKREFLIHF